MADYTPPYLRNQTPDFVERADCLLGIQRCSPPFLVHSQLLSHRSRHLATLFSLALRGVAGAGLPVVELPSEGLPAAIGALARPQWELFLQFCYEQAAPVSEVAEAEVLLLLGDFFQVQDVVARCEAWICRRLGAAALADPSAGLEELAVAALELAVKYRLTQATALLLPWALQRLSHGARSGRVWWDRHQRLVRLRAALPEQLKAMCMELFWWCNSGAVQLCPTCGARPEDLIPAFDFVHRRPWPRSYWAQHHVQLPPQVAHQVVAGQPPHGAGAGAPGPPGDEEQRAQQESAGGGEPERIAAAVAAAAARSPYQRAVAHCEHLLLEAAWGNTPAAGTMW